jgi:hypothetical protein
VLWKPERVRTDPTLIKRKGNCERHGGGGGGGGGGEFGGKHGTAPTILRSFSCEVWQKEWLTATQGFHVRRHNCPSSAAVNTNPN